MLIDIRNLLTLRYDPSIEVTSSVPKLASNQIKRDVTHSSSKQIEEQFREIINTAISKHNPKTISLALSTGVDSNLILSLLRDEYPNLDIKCISVSFGDEESEATYAKEIAESKDTDFYSVTVDNPLKDLPYLIGIVKEPRWNLYQYYFMEKSKKFSNILFTGDGGDELFGGYTFRYNKFLRLLKKDDDWKQRTAHYLECHERDWVPDQEEIFGENIKFDWSSIYSLLKPYFDNDLDPLDQVFLADYNGKLIYDFVPTNDKFFNYLGIMGISPILDNKIIELSLKIPPSIKFNKKSNMGKLPLREILSRLDSKNISDSKIGFGMDLKKLWTTSAKEIVGSNMSNASIFRDKLISRDFYERSIKRIEQTGDVRYISKMLQLLSLEIWYKIFITFESSPKSSL